MQEKRSHDRFPIELALVLVHRGERQPGRTRDLSLGGMFVYTALPPPFAAELELELEVPLLRYRGELPAVVRWVHASGAGLAFRSLRARDVHAFNQLFKPPP